MIRRNTIRAGAAALAVAGAALAPARPASAQIERVLAGIRLNTSVRNVIARFGNPKQVVVGDVPIRLPRTTVAGGVAGGGFSAAGGFGGAGGYPGAGGGLEGPAAGGVSPFPVTGGYPGGAGGYPGGGAMGGLEGPGGLPGMGGYPGGGAGGFGGYPGGGMGGPTDMPGGGFGGAIGGGGGFGNTNSTLARQQETTLIYDRPGGISYEFLIGADGRVIQIRAIGYTGTSVKTAKGIRLGSSYATVLQRYGYPEEHMNVGPILVASYRNKNHTQFQFLNNKVIAITIASVE